MNHVVCLIIFSRRVLAGQQEYKGEEPHAKDRGSQRTVQWVYEEPSKSSYAGAWDKCPKQSKKQQSTEAQVRGIHSLQMGVAGSGKQGEESEKIFLQLKEGIYIICQK